MKQTGGRWKVPPREVFSSLRDHHPGELCQSGFHALPRTEINNGQAFPHLDLSPRAQLFKLGDGERSVNLESPSEGFQKRAWELRVPNEHRSDREAAQ